MQPLLFPSTVSAREIQRHYKKVFAKVKKVKRPIVVMANNTPQAAIISLDMLEDYTTYVLEKKLFTAIDQIRAKNIEKDPQNVMNDITADVEDVRQSIYEETFGGR